jgi:integrase
MPGPVESPSGVPCGGIVCVSHRRAPITVVVRRRPCSSTGSWLFRYQRGARTCWAGLGRAAITSLVEARAKAAEMQRQLAAGIDPLAQKREIKMAEKTSATSAAIEGATFRKAAEAYIHAHWQGWRSQKHRAQWTSSIYALRDTLGAKPVGAIGREDVLGMLRPLWTKTPDSANRLRARIEQILDFAKASGWRTGENPARWKGDLEFVLPAPRKIRAKTHFAALDYRLVPDLFAALAKRFDRPEFRALGFTILTAARTGEVLGAKWDELDLASGVWIIPGSRMKSGREHHVPLSPPALDILSRCPSDSPGPFALGANGMLRCLHGVLASKAASVHGMRSAFRDWSGDCTAFPREVAEAALAHAIGDSTERAYRRGTALEKRRALMDAWADYCGRALVEDSASEFDARTHQPFEDVQP